MASYVFVMFAQLIRTAREEKGLLKKELTASLHIDVLMCS